MSRQTRDSQTHDDAVDTRRARSVAEPAAEDRGLAATLAERLIASRSPRAPHAAPGPPGVPSGTPSGTRAARRWTPAQVRALQRAAGNRATRRILEPTTLPRAVGELEPATPSAETQRTPALQRLMTVGAFEAASGGPAGRDTIATIDQALTVYHTRAVRYPTAGKIIALRVIIKACEDYLALGAEFTTAAQRAGVTALQTDVETEIDGLQAAEAEESSSEESEGSLALPPSVEVDEAEAANDVGELIEGSVAESEAAPFLSFESFAEEEEEDEEAQPSITWNNAAATFQTSNTRYAASELTVTGKRMVWVYSGGAAVQQEIEVTAEAPVYWMQISSTAERGTFGPPFVASGELKDLLMTDSTYTVTAHAYSRYAPVNLKEAPDQVRFTEARQFLYLPPGSEVEDAAWGDPIEAVGVANGNVQLRIGDTTYEAPITPQEGYYPFDFTLTGDNIVNSSTKHIGHAVHNLA